MENVWVVIRVIIPPGVARRAMSGPYPDPKTPTSGGPVKRKAEGFRAAESGLGSFEQGLHAGVIKGTHYGPRGTGGSHVGESGAPRPNDSCASRNVGATDTEEWDGGKGSYQHCTGG